MNGFSANRERHAEVKLDGDGMPSRTEELSKKLKQDYLNSSKRAELQNAMPYAI